jgi:hypothetical protein
VNSDAVLLATAGLPSHFKLFEFYSKWFENCKPAIW